MRRNRVVYGERESPRVVEDSRSIVAYVLPIVSRQERPQGTLEGCPLGSSPDVYRVLRRRHNHHKFLDRHTYSLIQVRSTNDAAHSDTASNSYFTTASIDRPV